MGRRNHPPDIRYVTRAIQLKLAITRYGKPVLINIDDNNNAIDGNNNIVTLWKVGENEYVGSAQYSNPGDRYETVYLQFPKELPETVVIKNFDFDELSKVLQQPITT